MTIIIAIKITITITTAITITMVIKMILIRMWILYQMHMINSQPKYRISCIELNLRQHYCTKFKMGLVHECFLTTFNHLHMDKRQRSGISILYDNVGCTSIIVWHAMKSWRSMHHIFSEVESHFKFICWTVLLQTHFPHYWPIVWGTHLSFDAFMCSLMLA